MPPEAVRMMTGFGRGITCGAVIGAVAAIGCATGRSLPGEDRLLCGEMGAFFHGTAMAETPVIFCGRIDSWRKNR